MAIRNLCLALLVTSCFQAPVQAQQDNATTALETLATAADSAQVADLASTGVGLAMGASELNPLGLGLLGAKWLARTHTQEADPLEQPHLWRLQSALGKGATANNICVTISLATGTGLPALLCPLVGLLAGHHDWEQKENLVIRAEFDALCAHQKKKNPDLVCSWIDQPG